MRPCNKNQFQSIRIQKTNTQQKRQEEEDDEDRKPKKNANRNIFSLFFY